MNPFSDMILPLSQCSFNGNIAEYLPKLLQLLSYTSIFHNFKSVLKQSPKKLILLCLKSVTTGRS